MSEPVIAKYLIETPHAVEFAAEMIAGEQSSGTFTAVPGETEELKARARARVMEIKRLECLDGPSLQGSRPPKGQENPVKYQRAKISVEFPFQNIGPNLPTLLATICGNLYELAELSGIKLLDLELPRPFADHYPGPQFGIEGTRKVSGVYGRPLIGTIVKPSVGLTPDQTADLVHTLGQAGIDFIKDDELQANSPISPFDERVAAVMRVINQLADRTGRKIMYAFNVTDDLQAMLRHHDTVLAAGGTCVMVSIHSVGLAALTEFRRHSQLPIHGHRNGWGMFSRHPLLGVEFPAWQKLWRLAGVDHLHVNGLQNKFWEPDDSVLRSIQACLEPMFRADDSVMPVISSGQWGGQAPETYRQTGTLDIMYLAGGGILAHPLGPAAGLRALHQAWEAAVKGAPLPDYAINHPELGASLAKFGKLRE